jgi:hypothetical protein
MEVAFVTVSFLCFIFSVYLVMLSVYVVMDGLLKAQLLVAATSFLAGGAVIVLLLTVLKIVGKILSKTKKAKTECVYL